MSTREVYAYLALAFVALVAVLSRGPLDALTWRVQRARKLRCARRRAKGRNGYVGAIRKGAP